MNEEIILQVNGLKTHFKIDRGDVKACDNISYTIKNGETIGFVGESGAGKSVTGRSILNLIDSPGEIIDGEILYKGQNLLDMTEEEIQKIRGNEIAIVFQDSSTAFNPSYTVGEQISDVIQNHFDMNYEEARERTINLLDDVNIPNPKERFETYPHQYSGGMRQRALIALALSCDPDLIIADEITTGIDVTTQAKILNLLKNLKKDRDLAMQFITHDMGVVAEICDRVAVMYAGEIVEMGTIDEIFNNPKHPYTMGLLGALPQTSGAKEELESIPGNMPDLIETPSGCSFRDRCEFATEKCSQQDPELKEFVTKTESNDHKSACIRVDEIDWDSNRKLNESPSPNEDQPSTDYLNRDEDPLVDVYKLKKYFDPEGQSWVDMFLNGRQYVHAVDDVTFNIYEGETVSLVGESGCGKTTLGRTITQLYDEDSGTVVFAGTNITDAKKSELKKLRRNYQVIFQDPFSSLNPRRTVGKIVGRPMKLHGLVDNEEEKRNAVKELLVEVGLKESHIDRYAHEFSGGQKQRIGIARALAVEPDFIVCDEPVSALDVSVQAKVLNLLMDLQKERNLTYLFIAHNLEVVKHISDRVAVMYLGEIVEMGPIEDILSPPYHPYTEILLSSIPSLEIGEQELQQLPEGEIPSPIDPPSGCRFHTRCPYAMPECSEESPIDITTSDNHRIKCHIFDDRMMEKKLETKEQIVAEQTKNLDPRQNSQSVATRKSNNQSELSVQNETQSTGDN